MTLTSIFSAARPALKRALLPGMFAILMLPISARADLIVSVGSVAAFAGSSGNGLEVQLTNTGPSAVTVGGFSFGVMTSSSDISFTDANTSTALPYIFAGNSLFGPDLTVSAAGQSLSASDIFATTGSGAIIGTGVSVGLAHLLFDVSAGATGVFPVTVQPFPLTSLSDALGNDLGISTLSPGSITITSTPAAVPEPSTFVLLAGGLLILSYAARRRTRG